MKNIDKQSKVIFIISFSLMFLLYGFCFFNPMFLSDSLFFVNGNSIDYCFGNNLTMINFTNGRIFKPILMLLKFGVASPFITGLFSSIFIALTIVIICKIFKLNIIDSSFLSILLTSNLSIMFYMISYSNDSDAYCLSILLSTCLFYILNKLNGIKKIILGIFFTTLTLGFYQPSICITFLLTIILFIKETLENKQDLLGFKLIKNFGILFLGLISYLILCFFLINIFNVNMSNNYNGMQLVSNKGIFDYLLVFLRAPIIIFINFWKMFLFSDKFYSLINIPFLLILIIELFLLCKKSKNKINFIASTICLSLIIPFFTYCFSIINGLSHILMAFSQYLYYFIPIILANVLIKKEQNIKLVETIKKIYITIFFILGLSNIIYLNNISLYNELMYDNLKLHFDNIWVDLNRQENYTEGTSTVIFIGNYDNKESIMSFNNKDEVFIRQYEKLVGTPVLYCPPEFCNAWIVNILGRNIKVENFDEEKYNLEDFKDIPSYPKDGYIKEIDGVFFVKTEPLN